MGSDGMVGSQRQTCLPRDCQVEAVFSFLSSVHKLEEIPVFPFRCKFLSLLLKRKRKELNGKDSAEPDIFFLTKTT